MVLDNQEIDWKRIFLRRDLSYRLHNKLSEDDKLKVAGLPPNELMLVLKIHFMYKVSLRKVLRKRDTIYEDYYKWLPTRNTPYQKRSHDKHLAKELKFRGFVPYSQYPTEMDDRYCYITSNRSIENTIWVYPRKFTLSYKQIEKDLKKSRDVNDRYIYPNFEAIALQGITKIQYCKL